MRRFIRKGVQAQLPEGYDVDTHFSPRYDPWDQRVCLVPDGDLFTAIRRGHASVVTDRMNTFTPDGLRLTSGAELPADIVVLATGLNLLALGGMQLAVDGRDVRLRDTVGYKGMMLSGIPNFAVALGYTNASWTLKCDLTCEYVCRLLGHMQEHGCARSRRARGTPGRRPSPSSTSPPGTCCARSNEFPARGATPRGACTSAATSPCCATTGIVFSAGSGPVAAPAA